MSEAVGLVKQFRPFWTANVSKCLDLARLKQPSMPKSPSYPVMALFILSFQHPSDVYRATGAISNTNEDI